MVPPRALATVLPRRTHASEHAAGFTLVELLVVIGIIAVLISILMPALAKARYHAKIVNCASNQRQMVLGMQMYINEHRGFLPRFDGYGINPMDLGFDYYNEFHDHIGLPRESFFCPESSDTLVNYESTAYGYFISGYSIWTPRRCYSGMIPPDPPAWNVYGSNPIHGPIKLGDALAVINPVITDTVCVVNTNIANPAAFDFTRAPKNLYWSDYSGNYWKDRLDVVNEGWIDGHVERVTADAVRCRYQSPNAWSCW